ncbi:glycoside hydrolase family 78 protein, partial [Nonomuraea sp. NPDC004297]
MQLAVTDMRVQGLAEPLGLDAGAPDFSWRITGDGRGRAQSAYRLIVGRECDPAADGAEPVWDSGVVNSPATFDVL